MKFQHLYNLTHIYNLDILWGIFIMATSIVCILMDIYKLVDPCPYCRIERIALLIVGATLALDQEILYFWISFPMIFFGLSIVSAQILSLVQAGMFPDRKYTVLATLAGYAFFVSFYIILLKVLYTS